MAVVYLDAADLFVIATRVSNGDIEVRDAGLLDAAAHRPQAVLFDVEIYDSLWLKAAALLQSIVQHRPLRQNNWRLGWMAVVVFCDLNGWAIEADDDEALEFVRAISNDAVELTDCAKQIEGWARRTH